MQWLSVEDKLVAQILNSTKIHVAVTWTKLMGEILVYSHMFQQNSIFREFIQQCVTLTKSIIHYNSNTYCIIVISAA
jgi:hypothetical protein